MSRRIDYVVVEDPAMAVRKVPRRRARARHADEIGRRSDGDRPHVQTGARKGDSQSSRPARPRRRKCSTNSSFRKRLITPNPERLSYIRFAFERGYTVEQIQEMTAIDPWFLKQFCEIVELEEDA